MQKGSKRNASRRDGSVAASLALVFIAGLIFVVSTLPSIAGGHRNRRKSNASGEIKIEQLVRPHVMRRQKTRKRRRVESPVPHVIQLTRTRQRRCRRTRKRLCYSESLVLMTGSQERFPRAYNIDPQALIEIPGSLTWRSRYSAVLRRLGVPQIEGVPAIVILQGKAFLQADFPANGIYAGPPPPPRDDFEVHR